MSGGGSQKVRITEDQIALQEQTKGMWDQWKKVGMPLEDEAVRRVSGYKFNTRTNEYAIDPNGILNADGTAKIDTTDARTAIESTQSDAMQSVNPNQLNRVGDGIRESAAESAKIDANMGHGQQGAALKGLVNSASMRKGQQVEATARQSDLAAQSQSDAIGSAQRKADRRATTGHLVGQVAGMGASAYGGRLSGMKKKAPTRLSPSDHHPGT